MESIESVLIWYSNLPLPFWRSVTGRLQQKQAAQNVLKSRCQNSMQKIKGWSYEKSLFIIILSETWYLMIRSRYSKKLFQAALKTYFALKAYFSDNDSVLRSQNSSWIPYQLLFFFKWRNLFPYPSGSHHFTSFWTNKLSCNFYNLTSK